MSIPEVNYKKNEFGENFETAKGWNQDTLQSINDYLKSAKNLDAFIAIENNREILSFGEPEKLINLHSARKPIMSLLIGIAQDKGLLNINETVGKIGITEHGVTLSEIEKSATIRDLLMARSGIYLASDAQPEMKNGMPKRGEYEPGEFYYYNNFDFNSLGTIIKIKTGMSYEECLNEWLAKPLEMQEFNPKNVIYGSPFSTLKTSHLAYKTWMSARDFAKIGAMINQKGIWKGKRIVSEKWIIESTTPFHTFDKNNMNWPKDSYGYLWTIDTKRNNIWGTGYGGQMVMIDTTNNLTLVQRHYTGNSVLSQGLYLIQNTQSSQYDLMKVWEILVRNKPKEN